MHKKSIRLFISALLLSLTVLVGGCGESTENINVEESPLARNGIEQLDELNSHIENSNADSKEIVESNISRFSAERCNISNLEFEHYGKNSTISFIITDHQTQRQYLYIYLINSVRSDGCAPVIVEIGTVDDIE